MKHFKQKVKQARRNRPDIDKYQMYELLKKRIPPCSPQEYEEKIRIITQILRI